MYSHADLAAEINQLFTEIEQDRGRIPKAWLTRAVMAGHPDIAGGDADFATYASECHVAREVERRFREIKAQETDLDEQFVLDGFKYVKKHYLVDNEGDIEAVHVSEMTADEIDSKAEELEAHARGTWAHAAELRRLAKKRRASRFDDVEAVAQ